MKHLLPVHRFLGSGLNQLWPALPGYLHTITPSNRHYQGLLLITPVSEQLLLLKRLLIEEIVDGRDQGAHDGEQL